MPMRDRPSDIRSLLQQIPPSDPDTLGWRFIDRPKWERLADLVKLPSCARLGLAAIVQQERNANRRRKNQPQRPAKARKQLERLLKKARDLIAGLQKLSGIELEAVVGARSEEADVHDLPLLSRWDKRLLISDMAVIKGWCDRLERAAQKTKGYPADSGANPALRRLANRLDGLLLCHTGKGLVRAHPETKNPRGRAAAHATFVEEIASMVLEKPPAKATVDDAIKDVIRSRRKSVVGRSRKKKSHHSPD